MTTSSTIKLLKVSTQFEPYIDSALKRLIYLHEGVDFVFKDGFIFVSFSERIDLASLKSEAAWPAPLNRIHVLS